MSSIALVTDSTATIPAELVREYNIHVVPQVVIFGEQTLRDGEDITSADFYVRLRQSDQLPTTSQATVAFFKETFQPLVAEGKKILAVLISSKLSGTIQSAQQAKAMFPEAAIEIVDSQATAMALGYQVLAAARAVQAGRSFEEVVALAREAHKHTGVFFVVDTLEYLHKGGRIGGAARLVGTALNIKPLLELRDGRIEPLERIRTKAKARARMLEVVQDRVRGHDLVRLAVLHADAEEEARALMEEAKARCSPVEAFLTDVSPAIGVHTGPGTLGVVYCVDL